MDDFSPAAVARKVERAQQGCSRPAPSCRNLRDLHGRQDRRRGTGGQGAGRPRAAVSTLAAAPKPADDSVSPDGLTIRITDYPGPAWQIHLGPTHARRAPAQDVAVRSDERLRSLLQKEFKPRRLDARKDAVESRRAHARAEQALSNTAAVIGKDVTASRSNRMIAADRRQAHRRRST